jgi:aminoglycoside 3-N-acetyltransferase I
MTSVQVEYRRANIETLRQLLKVFSRAFEDAETYESAPPSDEYLDSLLRREDYIPLVAIIGDQVVGGLIAYVLRKFEQERSEIYIYDLAVLKEFRRRHIATELINNLRAIATDIGAWVIYVQADYGDDPAIKLYESLGSREDVMHFDIIP